MPYVMSLVFFFLLYADFFSPRYLTNWRTAGLRIRIQSNSKSHGSLFYQNQKEGNYKDNSGSCVAKRLAARMVPGSILSPTPKSEFSFSMS
jgi:hypothetical protein